MDNVERGTIRYNNKQMIDAPYNRMLTGRVTASTIDGYSVIVNDVTFTKLLVLNGVILSVNDIVQIIVPNNQSSNMFILGKLG